MVLDDVTFVRLVAEGKVSLVTLTAVGGLPWLAGETVTPQNGTVGLRVVRGPDWTSGDQDGGPGNTGVLLRARDKNKNCTNCWFVKWESSGMETGPYYTGAGFKQSLSIAVAGAPAFALADVTTPPVIEVELVGSTAKESFTLKGNAEERITKMLAWLPQNGLALSGGKGTDSKTSSGHWARRWVFTRADLPF